MADSVGEPNPSPEEKGLVFDFKDPEVIPGFYFLHDLLPASRSVSQTAIKDFCNPVTFHPDYRHLG
jgi:hypothetical protein